MKWFDALLGLSAAAAGPAHALSAAEWRAQSVYQVVTDRFAKTDLSTGDCDVRSYCGGTWQGIIKNLDYIQDMGFTAIWISPVIKNVEGETAYGESYHGYWGQDIWSLNSNFGTEQDLKDLSAELHNRGMYLMVDVVTNHMGYNGCGSCVDYGKLSPFNSSDQYHSFCLIDYEDEDTIPTCWMGDDTVSLPDLRTEDQAVRETWNDWIGQMVEKYSIDGLRIDSVRQVEKDFWQGFGQAAGVYMVGEVFEGDPSYLEGWNGKIDGLLNFASYFWIRNFFTDNTKSASELVDGVNDLKSNVNTTQWGSFVENHDVPRFASASGDMAQAQAATAFALLSDGVPIVYQGQEQHMEGSEDPDNRAALWTASGSAYNKDATLYKMIASINQLRNHAVANDPAGYVNYQAVAAQVNDYAVTLRKGSVVSAYSNMGSGGSAYDVTLKSADTGFSSGQAVVEVLGCTELETDGTSGDLSFQLTAAPKIFYPKENLSGSGVCGN